MELSQQYGVQTVAVATHKNGTAKVVAAQGSVVDFTGTAIVNAANEGCLGGGGVDGAISNAGGDALYQARCELPVINAGRRGAIRCHTGDAKTTIAGDLPCKFVIHAVGPAYNYVSDYDEGDRLLYMAYRKSMCEARRMSMDTLAFSLLSAGIFRGDRPLRHVLSIAVLAVYAAVYDQLKQVFFVAFTREEVDTLSSVIHDLLVNETTREQNMRDFVSQLSPKLQALHQSALDGTLDPPPASIGHGDAQGQERRATGGQSAAQIQRVLHALGERCDLCGEFGCVDPGPDSIVFIYVYMRYVASSVSS